LFKITVLIKTKKINPKLFCCQKNNEQKKSDEFYKVIVKTEIDTKEKTKLKL